MKKSPLQPVNSGSIFSNSDINNIVNRFQNLAFATKEGIWEYDIIEKIAFYNEGMTELWGYSLKEMKDNDMWWRSNIHPQDKSRIITALDNLIKGDKTVWWGKYLFKHKDGSYKLILDRLFIVRNTKGEAIRMIGTMQDLTPADELQNELNIVREAEKRNMHLLLLKATENERKKISEELHENINQALASINMHLAWLKKNTNPEGLSSIADAQEMLLSSISGIREISNNLSPVMLESLGLNMALDQLFASSFKQTAIKYSIVVDEKAIANKDSIILLVLYRIAQAQVKNIKKHSNAENVLVKINAYNNNIRMTIYDDGNGIDFKLIKYGSGFSNIQNKVDALGGTFSIKTIHGETGFLLSVVI